MCFRSWRFQILYFPSELNFMLEQANDNKYTILKIPHCAGLSFIPQHLLAQYINCMNEHFCHRVLEDHILCYWKKWNHMLFIHIDLYRACILCSKIRDKSYCWLFNFCSFLFNQGWCLCLCQPGGLSLSAAPLLRFEVRFNTYVTTDRELVTCVNVKT